MSTIHRYELAELAGEVGRELGVSAWRTVTQEQVDRFADATDDHQWIHVERERAARESPYGGTIAHGFLSLSLIVALVSEVVEIADARIGINYGLDRVRFPSPVPVGSRIRARVALAGFEPIEGGAQLRWLVTVEREGSDKPCVVAEWITRRYA